MICFLEARRCCVFTPFHILSDINVPDINNTFAFGIFNKSQAIIKGLYAL